jgi:uncharacterized membrane protein
MALMAGFITFVISATFKLDVATISVGVLFGFIFGMIVDATYPKSE